MMVIKEYLYYFNLILIWVGDGQNPQSIVSNQEEIKNFI